MKFEGAEVGAAVESFRVTQKGCRGLEKPVARAGAWTLVPPAPPPPAVASPCSEMGAVGRLLSEAPSHSVLADTWPAVSFE